MSISKDFTINLNETEQRHEWKTQKFIHVAPSKWGKTAFWAQDEGHYFIKLEDRHRHIKHRGEDCRSWDDVENLILLLSKEFAKGNFPITTVIVDPVDRLIQMVDEEVIDWAKEKYKTFDSPGIGDIPEGNGWARRTLLINRFLSIFEELPCCKVLLFHSYVEEKQNRAGSKIKKSTIDVGGKAGSKISGWADHILHGEIVTVGNSEVRFLHAKGTETMEAGKSNPKLPDKLVQANDNGDFTKIKENFNKLRSYFE